MPEDKPNKDAAYWNRLIQSDPNALGYFYDNYVDQLFRAALRITDNRELAKDSKTNPLSDFNLHSDEARGPHYHVTPGQFPHIIGGYWGVMETKNRPRRLFGLME